MNGPEVNVTEAGMADGRGDERGKGTRPDHPADEPEETYLPRVPLLEVQNLKVSFAVKIPKSARVRPPDDETWVRRIQHAVLPSTDGTLHAVDDVSFVVGQAETLALVGESGCGKSTIGRCIVRLERPASGTVKLDGIDVQRARGRALKRVQHDAQMVFQDPYASLDPRLTAGQIVEEPLRALGVVPNRRERILQARALLARVGLQPRHALRYPHAFSGGERQRIAIARALAPGPRFIIADEPVSSLDVSVQAQIVNLLIELQEQLGLSLLFISHDLAVVRHIAHRVAVMYLGQLVEIAPVKQLYEHPRHPYTQALIDAVPIPDPRVERKRLRVLVSGDVPSALHPPLGCRFHPRCDLATDRCREARPALKTGALDRPVACHAAHGEA